MQWNAPQWARYLRGLWVSWLRLTESLELWWDRPDRLYPVFPKKGRPMLHVPGELEKGNSDRLLPIAPEFALFLAETPEPSAASSAPGSSPSGDQRPGTGSPVIPGDGASLSVDRAGIEPATHGFSVHCSTN
jgi:hypothetical protein